MKKLFICVFLLTALFSLTACQEQEAKNEDIYFISQADYDQKTYVMHYGGGDVIKNVYELHTEIACLDGSRLFYAEDKIVYSVELTSGEVSEYAVMPAKITYMCADGDSVYAICRPIYGEYRYLIYRTTPDGVERVGDYGALSRLHSMVIGDGKLFYIDDSDALIAYDTASSETEKVADDCFGWLFYGDGNVYISSVDRMSKVDISSGEKSFVTRGKGGIPHEGYIYYSHQLFCDSDHMWYEIFRRKDDSIELCGKASLYSMGFHELWDLITFGEYGFITQGVKHFDPTEYTYFPYGSTEGITLTVKQKS